MVCGARNEIEKPAGGIHPHHLVEGESMGRVLFFDEGDVILAFLRDRYRNRIGDNIVGDIENPRPVVQQLANDDLVAVRDLVIAGHGNIDHLGSGDGIDDLHINYQLALLCQEPDGRGSANLGIAGCPEMNRLVYCAFHACRYEKGAFFRDYLHGNSARVPGSLQHIVGQHPVEHGLKLFPDLWIGFRQVNRFVFLQAATSRMTSIRTSSW